MSEHPENLNPDLGKVIAINGSIYKVQILRGDSCGSCSMRGFCFKKDEPSVFDIHSDLQLKVGDIVSLEIAAGARIASALLIFGLPLALLLLTFILSKAFFIEIVSIGLAFAAMAISFFIIGWMDKKYGKRLKIEIGGVHDHPHE